MNKQSTKITLVILAAGCIITILAGCVEPQPYTYQYPQQPYTGYGYAYQPQTPQDGAVVDQAPPAPQQEVIPVAPGPAYVWLPGYWSIGVGGGWIWVGGHYAVRPYPHAVWARGHWDHHEGHYVWRHGHWH